MKIIMDRLINLIISALIVLTTFLFSFRGPVDLWENNYGNYGVDASVFYYVGRVMREGGMPYRDTFDHKGPVVYLLSMFSASINHGGWYLDLIILFVTFIFAYKIARLLLPKRYALFVLLFYVAAQWDYYSSGKTEAYALPLIVASLFISLDFFLNERTNRLRILLAGAMFGIVCLIRINMTAVWLVMCPFIAFHLIRKRDIRKLISYTLYFIWGGVAVATPILIWLIRNNAFSDFYNDYIIFNRQYINDGTLFHTLAEQLKTALYFINRDALLIALAIVLYLLIRKKNVTMIAFASFFFLHIYLMALSGEQYEYYVAAIIPVVIFPMAMFISTLMEEKSGNAVNALFCCILAAWITFPGCIAIVNHAISDFQNRYDGARMNSIDEEVSELVIQNTSKDDKIIVCGNWDNIYNITDRFAATKYSFQNWPAKINADIRKEFLEDLDTNRPKVVVLQKNATVFEDALGILQKNNYSEIYNKEGKNGNGYDTTYYVYIDDR